MSVLFKVNQLIGPATATSQAETDPGFQPKGLFILSETSTSNGGSADARINLGAASSDTAEVSSSISSQDAIATSDVVRATTTSRIINHRDMGATTVNTVVDLTSLDVGGFTLDWVTADVTSQLFNYIALAGDDITDVEVGNFSSNTTTGNQEVNLSGAFQPDVVFFWGTLQTASGQANNNNQLGFGVTDGTNQWAMGQKAQNSQATTNTSRSFINDGCFLLCGTASDAIAEQWSIVSLDSDGFTINIDASAGLALLVNYMAIAGGQWKVGTETQPTSATTKATTGVGFEPVGLILGSVGDTQLDGSAAHGRLSFGATDGTRNIATWYGDADAEADTITDKIVSNTKCIIMATEGTPTTDAEADLDSFGSDGFTLDWTTADASARVFGYVAVGSDAVVGGTTKRYTLPTLGVG